MAGIADLFSFDAGSIVSMIFNFFSQYSILGIGMIIAALVIFLLFLKNIVRVAILIAVVVIILKLLGAI